MIKIHDKTCPKCKGIRENYKRLHNNLWERGSWNPYFLPKHPNR